MDEQALIASCQAGNLQDFDPLYQGYVDRIYRFIYRRTAQRELTEDLTSVTFMKAMEKIHQYKNNKGVFAAWLYSIARNCITDHYRSHKDMQDIETVWDLASQEDVTQTVDDRVNFDTLKTALAGLAPDKRDIVMMRVWDGLSYKEIAQITGKSEANCKVIFSRTIQSLKATMPVAAFILFLLSPIAP